VDGSASGTAHAATHPFTFVDLGASAKASVTDVTSVNSTGWDLAFKRAVIYANSGQGGPGAGGAAFTSKAFDQVTTADAAAATFLTESFFDVDCNPYTDPTGAALTTFSTWYTYDSTAHQLAPSSGTWLVRGATGVVYKLAIETYYAAPDGTSPSGTGGTYVLKYEAL
jgi:hypothetical protein